jgi:hypothetical protein
MFSASLGTRERWSTLLAVVFVLVGMSLLGVLFTARTGEPGWLLVSLPFALLLYFTGRYAPMGYRLGEDGVHVERRAGPKVIAYSTIRIADREPRRVAGLTLFGSRGVFGHFGRFWNPSLGNYSLFLTNRDAIVWLGTTEGWIGLSPDHPDEFVARLRDRLGTPAP